MGILLVMRFFSDRFIDFSEKIKKNVKICDFLRAPVALVLLTPSLPARSIKFKYESHVKSFLALFLLSKASLKTAWLLLLS
jgi:hypothetical protein